MRSLLAKLVSIAAFAVGIAAQGLTINTPTNVVVCLPVLLTWSGGTSPYYLSILPGSQPTAPAHEDLGEQSGTSFAWTANIAVGTSLLLTIYDSFGLIAQSAPFTILNGTDTSCVGRATSTTALTSSTTTTNPSTPTPAPNASSITPVRSPTPSEPAPASESTTASGTAGSLRPTRKSSAGVIAGSIVGAVVLLVSGLGVLVLLRRRRNGSQRPHVDDTWKEAVGDGPQDKVQYNMPPAQLGTGAQPPTLRDTAGIFPSTSSLPGISAGASQLSPQQLEFVQSLVAQGVSGIALNRIIESLPGQDRGAAYAAQPFVPGDAVPIMHP